MRAFVGGRGAGKSTIGAYDLLKRLKPGRRYTVVAPTYPMLRDSSLRTFKDLGERLGMTQPGWLNKQEGRGVVHTMKGGTAEITFRSADNPDSLRGPNLSGAWLDEGSQMSVDALEIVYRSLREAGEAGWMTVTFTPMGFGHWTFEQFGTATEETDPALFRAPTKDNPFLDPAVYEDSKIKVSGLRARQELGGEFVSVEGAEWPAEYFPESIWFDDWPATWALRVIALDPSKGRETHKPKDGKLGDYSAFVLVTLTADGTLWIDADMDQVRDSTQIVLDGFRLCGEFQPNALAVEINQFQSLLATDFLRVARQKQFVLPLYGITNTEQKETRIRTIGPYLAQGRIRIRRTKGGQLLCQQLRDFPMGEHDDGPDGVEQAIKMLHFLRGNKQGPAQPRMMR